jgi:hypothetical protein
MAGADVRTDWVILLVGLGGGLVIETWGTQTQLWTYYTLERPPLWIIPAWPIASLSIDRLYRLLRRWTESWRPEIFRRLHWAIMTGFLLIMLAFVAPTMDKSLTWAALALCILLTLTPHDERGAVLTFLAGAGLDTSSSVGGQPVPVGPITRARRLHCSPSLRMAWPRWRSGGRARSSGRCYPPGPSRSPWRPPVDVGVIALHWSAEWAAICRGSHDGRRR